MDCLRSLFSCCCYVSEGPVGKYSATTVTSLHYPDLPDPLLALIADYAGGEGYEHYSNLQAVARDASPLHNLLIDRLSALGISEIPSQDRCNALAARLSRLSHLILKGDAKAATIPRLQPLQSLQFVQISDYDFFFINIPLLSQFPKLIGIDITPAGEVVDPLTDLQPQIQVQQLELDNYRGAEVATLFQKLPALTYVHIRNGIHIRLATLNTLSKDCQSYVAQRLQLEPQQTPIVFFKLPSELEYVDFSRLRQFDLVVTEIVDEIA